MPERHDVAAGVAPRGVAEQIAGAESRDPLSAVTIGGVARQQSVGPGQATGVRLKEDRGTLFAVGLAVGDRVATAALEGHPDLPVIVGLALADRVVGILIGIGVEGHPYASVIVRRAVFDRVVHDPPLEEHPVDLVIVRLGVRDHSAACCRYRLVEAIQEEPDRVLH